MRGVIDLGEMLKIQMRVHLRRADVGMPQHFLHGAQVAAGLQHVAGEAVTQHVRMDIAADALFDRPVLDAVLHGAGAEAFAALVDEQRFFFGRRHAAANREPVTDGFGGVAAQWHDARLAALAGDGNGTFGKVDGVEIEADQFGEAQAGRIEQLEDGAVAQRQGFVAFNGHQLDGLVGRQCLRQGFWAFRRAQAAAGVAVETVALNQVVEEAAPGGKHAADAFAAEAASVQAGDEAADVAGRQRCQRRLVCQLQQLADVARVVFAGQRAETALEGQVFKVAGQIVHC